MKGRYPNDEYVLLLRPNHPFAKSNGTVKEHRIVYEEYHKCILLSWVDIHHINGDKKDNRIENLLPLSHSQHQTIERKGMKFSETHRHNLSISHIGKPSNREGKRLSEETRLRISQKLKGMKYKPRTIKNE